MRTVILTELGVVIYDRENFVKGFPFKEPAAEYLAIKNGEAVMVDLIRHLSGMDTGVYVNDPALQALLKNGSIDAQVCAEEEGERIQYSKPEILVESGLAENRRDAMEKLREFAMQLSSSAITEASESPDLHIIQSINSLDDTDRMINVLGARLREWYGLHFPELENVADGIVGYAKVVAAGRRDDLSGAVFEEAGFPDSKVEILSLVCKKSRGGDISDENLTLVQSMAGQVIAMHDFRAHIEQNVEAQMRIVAPNVAAILGTAVGARILAKAGSLKRLATMPSSTIQILGAERALFRSIKTGSRPPKHGLLFQHPLVHAAPRWQRGKIARVVAAKAAIAARVDVFGGGLNKTLLDKLNVRIEEIDKKYRDPPPPKPRQEYTGGGQDRRRGRRPERGSSHDRGSRQERGSHAGGKKRKRKKFGRR